MNDASRKPRSDFYGQKVLQREQVVLTACSLSGCVRPMPITRADETKANRRTSR